MLSVTLSKEAVVGSTKTAALIDKGVKKMSSIDTQVGSKVCGSGDARGAVISRRSSGLD
jgi:hypothetical protein